MTTLYPIPPDPNAYTGKYLSGHRPGEQLVAELLRYSFINLRQLASDPTDQTLPQLLSFYPANPDPAQADPSPSIAMFRTWLAANAIGVRDAFPKHGFPLPLVAVCPLDERESENLQTLGDHHFTHVDRAAMTQEEMKGQFIAQQLQFLIITDDPQTTMFLYRVVWYIIFINKLDLLSYADFHNLRMSGGRLEFNQEMYPSWQYARQITISFDTIFDYYKGPERVPRAVSLAAAAGVTDGAHVAVVPASSST